MMLAISCLLVGWIKKWICTVIIQITRIVSVTVLGVFLCLFSNRGEIIVKGVGNIVKGLEVVTLLTERVPGTFDEKLFKVIFPSKFSFQVFFKLFQLSSKYISKYLSLLSLSRVDNKFPRFLYLSWSSIFLSWYLTLVYLVTICKPGAFQGLDLNFNLYLLIFSKGAHHSSNVLILLRKASLE